MVKFDLSKKLAVVRVFKFRRQVVCCRNILWWPSMSWILIARFSDFPCERARASYIFVNNLLNLQVCKSEMLHHSYVFSC